MKKLFIIMGMMPYALFAPQKHVVFEGKDYNVIEIVENEGRYKNPTVFNPNTYRDAHGAVLYIDSAGILPLVHDAQGLLHAILPRYTFFGTEDQQHENAVRLKRREYDYQHAVEMACQAHGLEMLNPKKFSPAITETQIFETGCELSFEGNILIYVTVFKNTTAEEVGTLCQDAERRFDSISPLDMVPWNALLSAVRKAQEQAKRDKTFIKAPVEVPGSGHVASYLARAMAPRLERLQALNKTK